MTNEISMPKIEPPKELKEAVDQLKIVWPGWIIYLGYDNEGGPWPVLNYVSQTPNSYPPHEPIRVRHSFLVPMADYNTRTWLVWCFERLCEVFRHEAGEIFEYAGVKVFAPHHGNGENPYVTYFVGDYEDTRVRAGETKKHGSVISNEELTAALKEYGQSPEGQAWAKEVLKDFPPRLPEVFGETKEE